jgi:hypothetical protein
MTLYSPMFPIKHEKKCVEIYCDVITPSQFYTMSRQQQLHDKLTSEFSQLSKAWNEWNEQHPTFIVKDTWMGKGYIRTVTDIDRPPFPQKVAMESSMAAISTHMSKGLSCCMGSGSKRGGLFLLTFPKLIPFIAEPIFRDNVLDQLSRDIVTKGHYCFETPGTGKDECYRCLALVHSAYNLCKSSFKAYIKKYGDVTIHRVNRNNGLTEYVLKDSKIIAFDNISQNVTSATGGDADNDNLSETE